jgi:hypothetical protein
MPTAENTMSLFGKILAIVNILAIVGVLALFSMNYNQRLKWQYEVFLGDLRINGLPIDDKEIDAQNRIAKEEISPKAQQDLFKQASPSTAVVTQKDEVARVRRELDNQIQTAADKNKQIAVLARILAPMSDTIEQHRQMLAYQTHLTDEKFPALKARLLAAHTAATVKREGQAKPYEERFHDALAAVFTDPPGPFAEAFLAVMKVDPNTDPNKALEQSLDNQLTQLRSQFEQMFSNSALQQRSSIARLLLNMVEVLKQPSEEKGTPDLAADPAYRRFFAVVGVKAGVEAVNEQASRLQNLAFEAGAERQRERNLFAAEHGKLVDLVRAKKADIDEHNYVLNLRKKEKDAHETIVDRRKKEVKDYEEALAAERRKTVQRLQELRTQSTQLFDERVKLRENSEKNQKLEKQIRALATGR